MADYLLRDQAPLTAAQWMQLDQGVTQVAARNLIGRRVIPLFGPFGPGIQVIAKDLYTGVAEGTVDLQGSTDGGIVQATGRQFVPLPMIYKDFMLHWRDLETATQLNLPLDISPAAAAAAFCARAEDALIFNGGQVDHTVYQGLTNVENRHHITISDWSDGENAFQDVVRASELLNGDEFFGPYALVVNPILYAGMNRLHGNSGVLVLEQVQKIATAGVYQTPVLASDTAVLLSVGAENMDLAVAQDLITAFLETSQMNHYFRVFESLTLRIKRPGAICTIARE